MTCICVASFCPIWCPVILQCTLAGRRNNKVCIVYFKFRYLVSTRTFYCLDHHYGDVIMDAIASQITSLTIVYSTVYSDADQRKHQSSASLAFVQGIHRGRLNSPHKWTVTPKTFLFDDVIMIMGIAQGIIRKSLVLSLWFDVDRVWFFLPSFLLHGSQKYRLPLDVVRLSPLCLVYVLNWCEEAVIIPTVSPLVALGVVIMPTYGTIRDGKSGIMTISGFQWFHIVLRIFLLEGDKTLPRSHGPVYNKTQQSANRAHNSWDIL